MAKYKCKKCKIVNDADSWNKQTILVCNDDDITKIEEIDFDDYENDIHCFDCPNCLKECHVDHGDIIVVK
jgi:hypothetical protein